MLNKKDFLKYASKLAFPIMIQNLIGTLVNIADTVMLGYVSQTAMSASSLANQYTFILFCLYYGMATGTSVLCAQYWGKGDKKTVEKISVIDNKLIKIKNARSVFNTNMKLKSGLSISEALIRMAMLNRYLFDCKTLAGRYPKTRLAGANKTEIEYRYINYDLQYAKDLYKNVSKEIMEIQKELNIINSSEVFDVDINL